jgi:hypothetical protein
MRRNEMPVVLEQRDFGHQVVDLLPVAVPKFDDAVAVDPGLTDILSA